MSGAAGTALTSRLELACQWSTIGGPGSIACGNAARHSVFTLSEIRRNRYQEIRRQVANEGRDTWVCLSHYRRADDYGTLAQEITNSGYPCEDNWPNCLQFIIEYDASTYNRRVRKEVYRVHRVLPSVQDQVFRSFWLRNRRTLFNGMENSQYSFELARYKHAPTILSQLDLSRNVHGFQQLKRLQRR
ncbi:hypothetical protein T439DRAFT_350213, partial [Meredithblackwellia eburnea MCA 4105]